MKTPRCTAADYLAQLRVLEPGDTEAALRKRLGVWPMQMTRWRKGTVGFRKEEAKIRARRKSVEEAELRAAGLRREAGAQQRERARVGAAARASADLDTPADASRETINDPEPLDPRMQAFLDALRDHDDRSAALDAAGITSWEEVQAYARATPAFARRYTDIMTMQLFRVEDAVRRKGAKGDTKAAQIYLQGADPSKYSTKLDVRHSGSVAVTAEDAAGQASWLASFRADAKPVAQLAAQAALATAGEDLQEAS